MGQGANAVCKMDPTIVRSNICLFENPGEGPGGGAKNIQREHCLRLHESEQLPQLLPHRLSKRNLCLDYDGHKQFLTPQTAKLLNGLGKRCRIYRNKAVHKVHQEQNSLMSKTCFRPHTSSKPKKHPRAIDLTKEDTHSTTPRNKGLFCNATWPIKVSSALQLETLTLKGEMIFYRLPTLPAKKLRRSGLNTIVVTKHFSTHPT